MDAILTKRRSEINKTLKLIMQECGFVTFF